MDGFLLIVVIYVVLTILGAMQKKKRQEQAQRELDLSRAIAPSSEHAAPAEHMTRLERALEALRRAELEARARAEAQRRVPQQGGRAPARIPLPPQQGGRLPVPLREEARAEFDYDSEASEDTEDSEEEIFAVEAINLDGESAREAEGRHRVVERDQAAPEVFEETQVSAIASRIQTAIVPSIPSAEVEEARPTARPVASRTPLGRFASGRVRDAVVLGEILARPVGERM